MRQAQTRLRRHAMRAAPHRSNRGRQTRIVITPSAAAPLMSGCSRFESLHAHEDLHERSRAVNKSPTRQSGWCNQSSTAAAEPSEGVGGSERSPFARARFYGADERSANHVEIPTASSRRTSIMQNAPIGQKRAHYDPWPQARKCGIETMGAETGAARHRSSGGRG